MQQEQTEWQLGVLRTATDAPAPTSSHKCTLTSTCTQPEPEPPPKAERIQNLIAAKTGNPKYCLTIDPAQSSTLRSQ